MFPSTLYSRFAPPVVRNVKKLDAKGLISQQPCPHLCRRGLLDKISLFSCVDNVFMKFECLITQPTRIATSGNKTTSTLIDVLFIDPIYSSIAEFITRR